MFQMKRVLDNFLRLIPDYVYISLLYFKHLHRFPNLRHPRTFNEKLQWLKLHDRKPEYTMMVDKIKVKEYVANLIGEEYIIPTLATYKHVDDIDIDKLPNQFVIKWNHDSGSVVICKDKATFNWNKAKEKLRKGETKIGFWYGREWPYKNVKPMLLAEKYMEDNNEVVKTVRSASQSNEKAPMLNDYKFYCFNGEPKIMFISSDRANNVCFDYYDMNLNHLDLKQGGENYKGQVKLPTNFKEMKDLAAKVSQNIPHVRTDFYEVNGRVYFGELTFFDSSGFAKFSPKVWDEKLGDLIVLPNFLVGIIIYMLG